MFKYNKDSNENGMLTVEAVMTLIPFILLVMGIISLTNIFAVHNRIQYAITNAANQISGYTYIYQAFGIRKGDQAYNADRQKGSEALLTAKDDLVNLIGAFDDASGSVEALLNETDVTEIGGDISAVSGKVANLKNAGQESAKSIKYLVNNPKEILSGIIYIATGSLEDWLKSIIVSGWAEYMTKSFLDSSDSKGAGEMGIGMTADEYLRFYNVVDGENGLDFSKSTMFTDSKLSDIDIVVSYKIDLYFLRLFLMDSKIEVVQRVKRQGWLDGDGGARPGYYKIGQE